MAQGLTPELIGAGGCCGAVSHQPHIQSPGTARRGGMEGWGQAGMGAGREGWKQAGRDADSAKPSLLPPPGHPPGFLPLPAAAQGGDESEFQRR